MQDTEASWNARILRVQRVGIHRAWKDSYSIMRWRMEWKNAGEHTNLYLCRHTIKMWHVSMMMSVHEVRNPRRATGQRGVTIRGQSRYRELDSKKASGVRLIWKPNWWTATGSDLLVFSVNLENKDRRIKERQRRKYLSFRHISGLHTQFHTGWDSRLHRCHKLGLKIENTLERSYLWCNFRLENVSATQGMSNMH